MADAATCGHWIAENAGAALLGTAASINDSGSLMEAAKGDPTACVTVSNYHLEPGGVRHSDSGWRTTAPFGAAPVTHLSASAQARMMAR
jgi:nitroimidazol reductase NimA-like FMN-containing flavoprotein (pyridoxamine 5'-phosphate oxidase superfamily)